MKVVVSYVATFKICPKNTSELESQPLMQNTFGVKQYPRDLQYWTKLKEIWKRKSTSGCSDVFLLISFFFSKKQNYSLDKWVHKHCISNIVCRLKNTLPFLAICVSFFSFPYI